jgi:predicted DNA-binding transcriptional regulator AlpA
MDIKSQRGTMSFMSKVIGLMQTQNPFVRLVPAQRSPDPMRPHFYTAASLAESLDVSRRTVSRWCAKGDLPPPVRIGRSRFWRVEDVHEALRAKGARP